MTRTGTASRTVVARDATASRPMTSQFSWVLLGLVIRRASYGYELARRFERDYGAVLPLSGDSHIYSSLNQLEDRDLIEEAPVKGAVSSRAGRQPKTVYRATERGRQEYRAWLLTQVDESRRSWLLFVQLLASLAPEPDVALEILERYRLTLLRQAARGRDEPSEPVDEASRLARHLAEEEQRLAPGRMLDWVDFAQREFEALAQKRS
jgi:DNA-binding PadR family transcriptional regulator